MSRKSNGTSPINGATQGPKRGRPKKAKPEPAPLSPSSSDGTSRARRVRATSSSSGQIASATLSTRELDALEKKLDAIRFKRAEIAKVTAELDALVASIREQREPKARKARKSRGPITQQDHAKNFPLFPDEPQNTEGIF
jgi:hypothetical protein